MSNKKTEKKDDSLEKALSILDPVKLLVEVQGEAFKIKQFKFVQGIKVIKILKDHPNAIPFELFALDAQNDTDAMIKVIVDALAECGDVIIEIIQLHLGKDKEWMENLEMDEVIDLTLAIIKANSDFFTQSLLPKFQMINIDENS